MVFLIFPATKHDGSSTNIRAMFRPGMIFAEKSSSAKESGAINTDTSPAPKAQSQMIKRPWVISSAAPPSRDTYPAHFIRVREAMMSSMDTSTKSGATHRATTSASMRYTDFIMRTLRIMAKNG